MNFSSSYRHDCFQRGLRLYPENNCYGYRPDAYFLMFIHSLQLGDDKFGKYKWYTYKEVWERIQDFGSGIKGMELTTFDSVYIFHLYEYNYI